MICTVSTIKDSLGNVERFVNGNLASGVDHMFVFLDAEDAEDAQVHEWLEEADNVTVIAADAAYWAGTKPGNLNARQVVNANVVNCLLAPFPWIDWLFHLDGDECLDVDTEELLGLSKEVTSVRLAPLEAVSREAWDGEVEYFKRLLSFEDLCLLKSLGVIEAPHNRHYFRGHVNGKSGIRPSLELTMQIHVVKTLNGDVVKGHRSNRLRLLHYESFSGEEFLRKWDVHLAVGSGSKFRPEKTIIKSAVLSVLNNGALDETEKRHYLRELYKRQVEDDFETLLRLGFLVQPEPQRHSHHPVPFEEDQADLLSELLRHLVLADKRFFRPLRHPLRASQLLKDIRSQLPSGSDDLARHLDACSGR